MRKQIYIALYASILSLYCCGIVQPAQFYKESPSERQVLVDHAQFISSDSGKVRLEVYYQLYNSALLFEEKDGKYTATYTVSITIRGKHDEEVAKYKDRKKITVSSLKESTAARNYRTNQFNVDLKPGKYKIFFRISDENGPLEFYRKIKTKLKKLDKKKPRLSEIELVQAAGPQKGRSITNFTKRDLVVVPSLTHTFSAGEDGKLLFYLEIYRGSDSAEQVTIETSLRHDRKGLAYRDTLSTSLEGSVTRQLREISLAEFRPGKYKLIVRLRERRFKKIHERSIEFEVPWTFMARLLHDYDTAIDQLSYLSDVSGLKELRKIDKFEDRVRAFNAFWAKRDPDPTTARNEMKISFYHRLAMADKLFSISYKAGWRTDRGRVYVQYGEPAQIDDYPISSAPRPYQIWHYYEGGQYRRFLFVDENEDGDFRLQYPYDGLNQRPDF